MAQISEFVKKNRKELHLTQPELAARVGVGLRFLRELEQGKQSLRMDKVNQVLSYFGTACGVDSEASAQSDIRNYRLSSLEEPKEYMLEEIMRQVRESAIESYDHAADVHLRRLEEIRNSRQ